ncbi:MAG: hypothetical protein ACOYY3_20920, partial [Chloroflexota bacterium]
MTNSKKGCARSFGFVPRQWFRDFWEVGENHLDLMGVNYTILVPARGCVELPHKKSNFVKDRCLKKDVTFQQYISAVGGAYDESTKQTRVI